jgi:putative RecB family exonuclease
MPIYSHSRLSAYEQCPLKFKYAYIDRIGIKRRTIEAFMGSRFHEVMEYLYGRVQFDKPDMETLKRYFNDRWAQEWNEGVEIIRAERTAEDYRAIGLKAIEDYYRKHEPFDEGHVLGLEKDIIVDLDGSGTYRLRCIIDRLMKCADGTCEIHDYKTSNSLPPQEKVDGDRQLALYEIAVRQAWPHIEFVDLIWHYVCFDVELRSRRNSAQLEKLKADLITLINEIESAEEFPPRESALCDWCDFQRICPLFAHRFKTEVFGNIDYEGNDGQALVNAFSALDAQKHELAARIKGIESEQERLKETAASIASREGVKRLYGDDHVLNIRDDIKIRYPRKEELIRADFEAAMKGLGLWDVVVDVSWAALKSLAEREEWHTVNDIPTPLQAFVEIEDVKQVRLAKRKDK